MLITKEERIKTQMDMYGMLHIDIDDVVRAMVIPCYNEYSHQVLSDAQLLTSKAIASFTDDPEGATTKLEGVARLMNIAKYCAGKARDTSREKEMKALREMPEGNRIEQAVTLLGREVNGNSNFKKMSQDMLDAMNNEHRTLQASTFRLLSEFINLHSVQQHYCFDARNESTLKWSQCVAKATQDIYFPYI
jgi:hypothetical protein